MTSAETEDPATTSLTSSDAAQPAVSVTVPGGSSQQPLSSPPVVRKGKPVHPPHFLKVLSLTEDEEQLFNNWKMINRTKGILDEGQRMENASWRRWFQKKNKIALLPQDQIGDFAQGTASLVDADGSLMTTPQDMTASDSTGSAASPNIHGLLRSTMKKNAFTSPSTSAEDSTDPSAQTTLGDADRMTAVGMLSPRLDRLHRAKTLPSCLRRKPSVNSAKKRVSFDEAQNKTTYVSYLEEKWDDSAQEMLLNVDELSRLRHSHLNGYQIRPTEADLDYFMGFKDPQKHPSTGDKQKQLVSSLSPLTPLASEQASKVISRQTHDDFELMREHSSQLLSRDFAYGDDDNAPFDVETLVAYYVELILFLRWCAAMCFLYPGSIRFLSDSE